MGRKSPYSKEDKITMVLAYKSGMKSSSQISFELGVNDHGTLIENWIYLYDTYGESGFEEKPRNVSYSLEFKQEAVHAYLSGQDSILGVCRSRGIPTKSTLRQWIRKYNDHEELREYCPKGEVYMIKSRKTTMDERIEIVRYCIAHGNEYKIAAEWFHVSYAQVYQWVKKYESNGEEGLRDRRGMRKNEEKLSDIERLQRKIKQLEQQLELKERETEVLKKVQEIERRRSSPEAGGKRNTKPSNN